MEKDTDKGKKEGMPRLKFRVEWFYLLAVGFILWFFIFGLLSSSKEIDWQVFEKEMLSINAVERVEVVNNEIAEVFIKKEFENNPYFKDVMKPTKLGANPGPHYYFNIGSIESFEAKLSEAQSKDPNLQKVNVRFVKRRNVFMEILQWVLPFLLILLIFRFFTRSVTGDSGGSSIFNFGRSTAMLIDQENKSVTTFNDVAGMEESKQEIKEIVDFLRDPSTYTKLGAKIPKGVMIVGPPGTGKTLLAKAVAGEAKVPFFSLSGSEFVEMFVGVGASRVRDLFKRAKEKAPCIVFIDEIDAVGRSRGRNTIYSGANDERESTLNQLLTELDGFGTNSGVIVLAATNRADMLDPALLRPGRFDRHIYLELPNQSERKEIFMVHLKPIKKAEDVDINFLASQTPGFSGADIANICNEAALIAARRKKEKVEKADFLDAIERIVAGIEKKSKIISAAEKKIIAYHEAGHAVVSWLLKYVDPLVKVSIIPRGKSLGAAWYLPEERQFRNKAQFEDVLCAALGGRAAEEIIFNDVTSGAMDDLEKVTKQAYIMVAYYGLNKKVGNVSFYSSDGLNQSGFQKPYSEETGKIIDEEVRLLIENAYQKTKDLLVKNKTSLTTLADLLLQKEVVYKEDLEKILGKRFEEALKVA